MLQKNINVISVILITVLMILNCGKSGASVQEQDDLTNLAGEYLGQTPPGSTPELFAPGFISRQGYFEHSGAVFSPDLQEVYWAAKPDSHNMFHIYFMKLINGRWTSPRVTSFTKNYEGNRPAFSPDGNKL